MEETIRLNLVDEGDDPNETQIEETIQSLVNNTTTPAAAAKLIDAIITADCEAQLAVFRAASPSQILTERNHGAVQGPQPTGWQRFLWDRMGVSAMLVPAQHAGQERLVGLMRELMALPRHKVPWWVAVQEELTEKELWAMERRGGYEYFDQWMWELHEGKFWGWRQVEDGDPALLSKYINFNSFLARLLGAGLIDTSRLCPLTNMGTIPFPKRRVPDDVQALRRYEPYACAGAQWIIYAGTTIYQLCQHGGLNGATGPSWMREKWRVWKSRFEVLKNHEETTDLTKGYAEKAFQEMCLRERENDEEFSETLKRLGFVVPLNDDEVEEEEEGDESE